MHVKMMRFVEGSPKIRNYDYTKFAVYTDGHRFLTNIYKQYKTFYNLFERTPFNSMDDCLKSLPKHIKTN